jgi:glycine oxidase
VKSIAVIGGGIIGLSIAWRLAQRSLQVTVFDQASIGGEASWAGAGMLSPGGEVIRDSELACLAIESRKLYTSFVRELEQASGTRIDYQECGALDLAYSPAELAALEARVRVQERLGIPSKPLTVEQVRNFWPRVRTKDLGGARFYPGDGLVNPREVMAALETVCRGLGASLRPHRAIRSIELNEGRVVLNGRSEMTFHAAVIAAGAWSSSICLYDERGNLDPLPASEPVKGHLIGYRQPLQTCNTMIRRGHMYLLQRANGLLLAGASIEHVGFDRRIAAVRVNELHAEASFVLPHLAEIEPSEMWIGFRPASGRLQIGPWKTPQLYLAYGHFRNGILLAPVTAERIAGLLA